MHLQQELANSGGERWRTVAGFLDMQPNLIYKDAQRCIRVQRVWTLNRFLSRSGAPCEELLVDDDACHPFRTVVLTVLCSLPTRSNVRKRRASSAMR